MPTYEYRCSSCLTTLERRQSFAEAPLVECPDCGGDLRRVLSAVGVIFKGNGWYSTDSRTATDSVKPEKAEKVEKPEKCETCPSEPACASASAKP